MPSFSESFSLAALGGWTWLMFGAWYRFTHRPYAARTRAPAAGLALGVLVAVGGVSALVTALVAALFGARFTLALDDTKVVMAFSVGYLLALGFVWDAAILVGSRLVPRLRGFSWEACGFFSLGLWPIALLALTSYFVVLTSNVTLTSLVLLHGSPAWRDELLFSIERPLLVWTTGLGIDPGPWDDLYFSCWPVELVAVLALVLLTRKPQLVLHFCLSLVLLYYLGRFAGLLNPVKGPAFFVPERYAFLAGTVTQEAVTRIALVIAADPATVRPSALLLGGVSAMPSLHVGMVSLTAYWLAVGARATLYFGVPWVLAVWCSTVVLGWHYALDGLGGIALAALCAYLTRVGVARLAPALALRARG